MSTGPQNTSPLARRRYKLLALAGVLVLGLLVVVGLGPSLAMRTPLRNQILSFALGPYPAQFRVESSQLGWWEPVELEGLQFNDLQGRTLIDIDHVETEKDLISLAMQGNDIGRVSLHRPTLHLHADEQGNNLAPVWEAYADNLPAAKSKSAAQFAIEVTDGRVEETGTLPLGLNLHALDGNFSFDETLINGRLSAKLAGGQVTASPRIALEGDQVQITQSSPLTFRGIELRPEQINDWLHLLAPLLSGTSEIEGQISGEIASIEVPLSDPQQGFLEGELEIEAGRIQAGPLSQAAIDISRRMYALLERPEKGSLPSTDRFEIVLPPQTMSFTMRDGRIAHDKLVMISGGLELQTSGSVAFDESIDLRLTAKIPNSWVDETQWLAELADEQLEFRVEGTLSDPRLDDTALVDLVEKLGTKVVVEGVADAIEDPILDLLGF